MPLDPSIPLSFRAPEVALPTSNIGQLMQMRGLASEVALRNAQTEQAQQQTANIQAEAQQKNMALRDQNYLMKASLDPAVHARLAIGDTSDVSGHVMLGTEQAIQEKGLKLLQDRAALTTSELANWNTANKTISDAATGLAAMQKPDGTPDFDRINASLPSTLTALAPAIKTIGLDPANFNQKITNIDQLHGLISGLVADTAVNDKVLAQKKTAAETAASTAATAETNQKVAILTRKIAATDAMTQPGGLDQMVAGRIPAQFGQFRADALAAAQTAAKLNPGDPSKVAEAIEKVAAHADEIQKNADPTNIHAAASKAGAEEAARSPIQTRTAIATATGVRSAEAAQAPPALRGIVDPQIRAQVGEGYQKANEEYQGKLADATRLQQFVDAARSGNQAAMKMVPIAELRGILNRVTNTELGSAGTGATWARQLADWVKTGTVGRPTDDTLNGIEQVGKLTLESAKTGFEGKVQNYRSLGADYPLEPPAAPAPPKPQAPKPQAPKPEAVGVGGYIPGHSYGGKAYLGGDPKNPASWK